MLEGSADYVAERVLGNAYRLDDERNEYGIKNADKLISDFKTSMLSNQYSPWLYTPLESMPMDMGY